MPRERLARFSSERREFLYAALLSAVPASLRAAFYGDELYVLVQDDIGRLKADFNTNLTKVRLILMLSPT